MMDDCDTNMNASVLGSIGRRHSFNYDAFTDTLSMEHKINSAGVCRLLYYTLLLEVIGMQLPFCRLCR